MSSERWRTLEELFEGAVELEGEEREAFLRRHCAEDEKLLRSLRSLLAADTKAGTYLEGPLAEAEIETAAKPSGELLSEGQWVGPYRIIEKVGEGGMSTVYRAVREDDTFRRQVALKVIRRGMESAETHRRFRIERQILARLEHPNIAHLYDGGMTEEGLPYFVMELVDGEPIDRYCDRHGLSIERRLSLVRKICAAVHYAHQNLVVHRDLKPSNILVNAAGEPKLLDFGIAKLLGPSSESDTEATSAWLRLLTPHYASPEQLENQPVSTISDVYSLGVLLFKLLTGRLPFRQEGQSLKDFEALVLSSQPIKPSLQALRPEAKTDNGSSGNDPEKSRGKPGARTQELSRRLSGDLDTIVLKAMNRAPQRRYDSAERLAEDLNRHLNGFPVLARPDTWTYRSGKFLRRHWIAVTTAAAIAAILAAGGSALATQTNFLRLERDQLQEVISFVIDVFQVAGEGEQLTVRQAVDRSTALLETRLRRQPSVQATLRDTIGRIYLNLGVSGPAQVQLQQAVELRRQQFGSGSPEAAKSLSFLGLAIALNGSFDDGEARSREALLLYRDHLGEGDPGLLTLLNNLVDLLCNRGDAQDEATILAQEALELARQMPGEPGPELAQALTHSALLQSREGNHGTATGLYRQALDLYRQTLGKEHPEVAAVMNNLAFTTRRQGELEKAEALYRQSLALHRKLLGDDSSTVAQGSYNLASVLLERGSFKEAEEAFREAVDIVTAVHGEDHYSTLLTSVGLASALIARGSSPEAEGLLRQGLKVWRGPLGGSRFIASVETVLGESLTAQGKYEEAEPLLERGHRVLRETYGDEAPATRLAAGRLESLYRAWGRPTAPSRPNKTP